MKLTGLASTIAKVTGFDEGRVTSYCRYGREAGLFPKAGRGLAAASVEPEHAFDLILGLTISDTASESPKRVSDYYNVVSRAERFTNPPTSRQKICRNERIQRVMGRFFDRFGPLFVGSDLRTSFGNLIRAEMDDYLISKFHEQIPSHNNILFTISWPIPIVRFRFRDEETEISSDRFTLRDTILYFGGTTLVDDPKLQKLRGEYRATFHTTELIEIAVAFRNA